MRHEHPPSSNPNTSQGCSPSAWRSLMQTARGKLPAALLAITLGTVAPAVLAEVSLTTAYTDASTAYFGDVRRLRITVTNSAEIPVTDGVLSVPGGSFVLPSNFEIAAPPNPQSTCGAPVVSAGGRNVQFSGATIPPASGGVNGTCSVEVDVRIAASPSSTTSYTSAVNAGWFTGGEGATPVSNAGNAEIGLTVGPIGTLSVTKAFSPATIRMGDASTITITITNPAGRPRAAAISSLQENLPGNVTATGTVTGGTCGAGIASGTSGNVAITLGAARTLNPGESCTVTWQVRGNAADGNTSTNTNTVPANSVANDRSMGHAAGTANITVQSPVTLGKNFEFESVRPNEPVRMRITLPNRSGADATVSFTDNLPVGMVVSTPSGLNVQQCGAGAVSAVPGGNLVSLSNGTSAAGATCAVEVNVEAATPNTAAGEIAPYTNTIPHADWSQTLPGVGNIAGQTASASAEVTVFNEFTIHKSFVGPQGQSLSSVGPVPGDLVRFRVELRNYSAALVEGVSVTDVLPQAGGAQLRVATAASPGGVDPTTTCAGVPGFPSAGDSTAVFTGLTVPAGAGAQNGTCHVEFHALVPADWPVGTSISNDLSTQPNAGITCTSGNCTGQVGGQRPSELAASAASAQHLRVTKGFSPVPVTQGQASVMTITLLNNGFWDLNAVSVVDALPQDNTPGGTGQLVVAPIPGAATTCGGTPVYAYPDGRREFNVSGLTVPARGACRVSVNVVGALAGSYPNVIPPENVAATDARDGRAVEPDQAAQATLVVTPTFSVDKSFSPATVAPTGGQSRVTITVTNNGTAALTGMSVTDPLAGTGLEVAQTPAASTTCAGPTVLTAAAGTTEARLEGAQVSAGTSCTFSFNVVTDGSLGNSPSVNTLPPGAVRADGGLETNTATGAQLNKLGGAGVPFVQKGFAPNTLTTLGETSLLTITINNNEPGAVALSGMGLVDDMPEAIEVATPLQASTTCPGGVVSAIPGGNRVALSDASLAAGGSCEVRVNVSLNRSGTHTNTVQPGWLTNAQNVTNTNTFPANLGTVARAGVDKSFSPASVAPGEASLMTIRVINRSSIRLSNLNILDDLTLVPGLVPASPNNASTTCGGVLSVTPTRIELTGGTVPANSTCLLNVEMTAAAAGTYTNRLPPGSVTVEEEILIPPGDPVTGTLEVHDPLTIAKSFAHPLRQVNESNRMTITVSNPNASAVTNVSLTDSYPQGMFNTTTPNPVVSCTSGTNGVVSAAPSGSFVRLTGATLAPNGSCTIEVDVLSNTSGAFINTIPAAAVSSTEGVTNANPAQDQFVVPEPPTLGKSFNPVQIAAGGSSALSIVLGNENVTPITLTAHLDDDLPQTPGAMTATGINAAGTTCAVGSVSLLDSGAGANTRVRYASGAAIPAGGCVIVVNVTATAPGQYNNQIPAGALETNVGANPEPGNAVLAISTQHALSGTVYMDDNDNGLVEAGELGLSGQVVELWRHDGAQYVLQESTVTDSLGNYAFLELPDGRYQVRQPNQPPNTLNGRTTAGSAGGTATAVATVPSAITDIELSGAGVTPMLSTGNNFGELAYARIGGKVFVDTNNDGVQNGTEEPLPGEVIRLQRLDGGSWVDAGETVTAADGSYEFRDLVPGTYRVVQPDQPAGTANGQTIPGTGSTTAGTPSNPNAPGQMSQIEGIVLGSGQASTGNDFAETPSTRTVSGRVFLDYDDNDVLDGSDHGIGGLEVTLSGNDINGNPVSLTTTTQPDGSYAFTGVPEGTNYTITQPGQPSGAANKDPVAGSTGGAVSHSAASSQITGVDLSGVQRVSSENNFPKVPDANAPDLTISKSHSPATFSAGSTSGYYTIVPSNVGLADTSGTITVVDTLPDSITALDTPTGNGWNCGVAGQTVTCVTEAVIAAGQAGETITLRVAVADDASEEMLLNTVTISGGGEPDDFTSNNTAEDPTRVLINASASVAGRVWRDRDHDRVFTPGEPVVPDWMVELWLDGVRVATTTTDENGAYLFDNLAPGDGYEIRFREPSTGMSLGRPVPNEQGAGFTPGVVDPVTNPGGADNTRGSLSGFTLQPGANVVEQSLPLDPAGVVYDAVTRAPVQGAVVAIDGPAGFDPATHLVGGSPAQSFVTGPSGFYQFLLTPTAPAGTYNLTVTSPPSYVPGPSTLIPVCDATVAVGAVPDPALVQISDEAPGIGVPQHDPLACQGIVGGGAPTTQYYFSFNLDPLNSADVLNNHIPLDPILGGAIRIVKTSPLVNVTKGQAVPYTITATNTLAASLADLDIVDQIPAGFRYRTGSASVRQGGSSVFVPTEPTVAGRSMTWSGQDFAAGETKTYRLVLMVGAGVGEGEYTNLAWAHNPLAGARVSNVGEATVRIIPDPLFDCSEIIGTVFDDRNANGYQDQGELGIPNARVVTARGLLVTTDAEGRFHVKCADIPNADRGSNFVMKLDERTLPSGFRVTSENPRDVRVTRGKMVKLNFGATIHKVVRIEVDGRAFVPGEGALQPEWAGSLQKLVPTLLEQPSVARLAYVADADGEAVAKRRLKALEKELLRLYREHERDKEKDKEDRKRPPLIVEHEVMGAVLSAEGAQQ